jgi:hypothetical protein
VIHLHPAAAPNLTAIRPQDYTLSISCKDQLLTGGSYSLQFGRLSLSAHSGHDTRPKPTRRSRALPPRPPTPRPTRRRPTSTRICPPQHRTSTRSPNTRHPPRPRARDTESRWLVARDVQSGLWRAAGRSMRWTFECLRDLASLCSTRHSLYSAMRRGRRRRRGRRWRLRLGSVRYQVLRVLLHRRCCCWPWDADRSLALILGSCVARRMPLLLVRRCGGALRVSRGWARTSSLSRWRRHDCRRVVFIENNLSSAITSICTLTRSELWLRSRHLTWNYFCSAGWSSSMGTRTRRSPEGGGDASVSVSTPAPSTQVANPPRAATKATSSHQDIAPTQQR